MVKRICRFTDLREGLGVFTSFVNWGDAYRCSVELGSELYTISENVPFSLESCCAWLVQTIVVLFDFGILSS